MSDGVVRWGVLSTANIDRKVVPATRAAERCEVVAIGSRDRGRAEAAASEFGIARAYGSYDEVLADPDVDAVYIPLPNHLHAEWTIAAARAGKHVLCEKPLAMTAADAERMISACEAEGVLLMEAFMYRLHPTWEAVREITASGRIGELRAVQSWFSYFNDDPTDIRNILEAGGGALFDIGCYSVNLSRMLFAAEPTGTQARVVRDPEMGIDVLTSAIAPLPRRRGDVHLLHARRVRPTRSRLRHAGADLGRDPVQHPARPSDARVRRRGGDPPVSPDVETLTFDPADAYAIQAERFASAVLDGTPVPVPPADAVANLRVIEEIFRVG